MNEKHTVSESIFSGETVIIPMAEVHHIERRWYPGTKTKRAKNNYDFIFVILNKTEYNVPVDEWNGIAISGEEAESFLSSWCFYRHELEGNIKDA